MLKQFRVDNFKSLVNVTFEPAGLNLLVGQNNAGKTNLCQALHFLSLTSKKSLQEAAGACTAEPWVLANVYLTKPTIDLFVSCSLTLDGHSLDFEYELCLKALRSNNGGYTTAGLEVKSETLSVTGGGFQNTPLLENQEGVVRLLDEEAFLEQKEGRESDGETTAPIDHTMLFRLYEQRTNPRANLFKRYLGSWEYFDFDPVCLRNNRARPMDMHLLPDGSNLASVLYTTKSVDERLYRRIFEAVKAIEPKLDVMNFFAPDPEHVYLFIEDTQERRFGMQNLSAGTLRYMALCTAITLNRGTGNQDWGPPVIMVEEPEDGIYVGLLKPLFEKLEPSGRDGQYLFTSHAPYFIDLFEERLDGIWVVKSQTTHSSVTRPDRAKIEAKLGEYSLGEMHFWELLE